MAGLTQSLGSVAPGTVMLAWFPAAIVREKIKHTTSHFANNDLKLFVSYHRLQHLCNE